MRVNVRSLYYMICYAWGVLDASEPAGLDCVPAEGIEELLGRMLLEGVARLARRGLAKDYVTEEELTQVPRGKISMAASLRKAHHGNMRVVCERDGLTPDVLANRILKTTMLNLANLAGVTAATRSNLHHLASQLREVGTVTISSQVFQRVRVHGTHREYRPLLQLCELCHGCLLPEPSTGRWRFQTFTGSDQVMGRLFEEFVRNFMRREQQWFRVERRTIAWQADGSSEDRAFLPEMKTDIHLTAPGKTVVVETKCTNSPLASHHDGAEKLLSGHLYQLMAYLANLKAEAPVRPLSGALLYGSSGSSFCRRYSLLGFPVTVRAIDLDSPWERVRADVLELAAELALQQPGL